ncbi:MAG TPA: hypothetical protein VKW08_06660 [Xanthobacteraceae bacterium]|nr:hypothetical protein [Xanthobacteraceae bacterium]
MPQIWLTYAELADMIGCDPVQARATASMLPLDRRRCHDGQTRAKLNAHLAEVFLDRLAREWMEREIAGCVGNLRETRELMLAHPLAQDQTAEERRRYRA